MPPVLDEVKSLMIIIALWKSYIKLLVLFKTATLIHHYFFILIDDITNVDVSHSFSSAGSSPTVVSIQAVHFFIISAFSLSFKK